MFKSGPNRNGKSSAGVLAGASLLLSALLAASAVAQEGRQLEAIDVQSLPGQVIEFRLQLNQAAPEPVSFTMGEPARIVVDLAGTGLALQERDRNVNLGAVASIQARENNDRTRIAFNLNAMAPYTARVEGNAVIIEIGSSTGAAPTVAAAQPGQAAPAAVASGERAISNIDFRRGPDGAGQVLVELTQPGSVVDVREEGGRIVLVFEDTVLPDALMRRLDVADFATPVATVDAMRDPRGNNVQLLVTPSADYEQVSYQADNRFTLELKTPAAEDQLEANIFNEGREYTGDPLTLTFQDLETRAVLQLLADFSDLNIVVSDTVQGSVTLRLQDVPWDQALDIVMTTKGLDMRRNGNVIIVAPAEEIAAREAAQLEALRSLQELEPLYSDLVQVNYAKASDLAELIRGAGGEGAALLTDRGSVTVDGRTNQLLVRDTQDSLRDVRRLVTTLDVPVRQVSIESRIVIVNDDFARELGVRFGTTIVRENSTDGVIAMTGSGEGSSSILGSALDNLSTSGSPFPVDVLVPDYNVNLPVANPAGSLALAILDNDFLVDLELTAVQTEGKGEIYSTPRVITANNKEARIEQGVEIPYQESSSSGATTTSFKEAVLSLTVTPQITPDDRIIMDLLVTKDSVGEVVPSATGGFVPSIDTRSVQNQVLVDDGQTVVLGGIYETETRDTVNKVPVLGDIPGLGFLFRTKATVTNKSELLIFVTPRIIRDGQVVE